MLKLVSTEEKHTVQLGNDVTMPKWSPHTPSVFGCWSCWSWVYSKKCRWCRPSSASIVEEDIQYVQNSESPLPVGSTELGIFLSHIVLLVISSSFKDHKNLKEHLEILKFTNISNQSRGLDLGAIATTGHGSTSTDTASSSAIFDTVFHSFFFI